MSIEVIQEAKEQVETVQQTVQQDGWSQAFDDIINADFSGFNTLIAVIIFVVLLKPILFVLRYVFLAAVLFVFVKYFLFYAQ